jgi:hypothetical protein
LLKLAVNRLCRFVVTKKAGLSWGRRTERIHLTVDDTAALQHRESAFSVFQGHPTVDLMINASPTASF